MATAPQNFSPVIVILCSKDKIRNALVFALGQHRQTTTVMMIRLLSHLLLRKEVERYDYFQL